ncbi:MULTISPECIES: hypothetical protein [unclassified Methylobacterium]|uniref:hypothetical protein n=1 Tax=unclassified Methylobacterium TaxID=2615210 RepID=UPI0011C1E9FA|nr:MULTISPECIES: hypothetical protein [unclassified Methylobacterium]QEE37967.1 hypothetical protein FVA80_02280 [Methylobacterium sp. WL1]TXN59807.1 hypothetical protein FV241_00110 [Methylobacterium sp. WL2]
MSIQIFDGMAVLRRRFDTDHLGRGPRTVFSEMLQLRPGDVAVWCFEGTGSIKARRAIYPGYKDRPSSLTDGLRALIDLTRDALAHTRAIQVAVPGREADDVIAHLCDTYGSTQDVLVHTIDRDLLALQRDRVRVDVKPLKIVMDPADHTKDVLVEPCHIRLFKALCGDPSDKIPGMPGFGGKAFARCLPDLLQAAMQELVDGRPRPALFVEAGVKEAMAGRMCEPDQAEQLRAFWQIVGFLPMPDDWHRNLATGTENAAAGDAVLRRFMH